jgi:DNA sulfur modification protein DndD
MIFTRLSLRNYGLFRGEHHLELAPDRTAKTARRNIILFGGKNGAGKTTLLEAVRLCLYGQRSRGVRVRRRDYEKFLRSRVHRVKDGADGEDGAAVSLEFEHVSAGKLTAYRLERSWSSEGAGLKERLTVYEDGVELSEFDRDHWENFVAELIPPGISQLFFFDGEKIQAMAEEEGEDSELAHSIKALLSLDLADRLIADLSVYQRRHGGAAGTESNLLDNLRQKEDELAELLRALRQQKQARAGIESRIGWLRKQLRDVEDEFSMEGGSFARHREELIERRARLEEELLSAEAEARDAAARLLPFALVPQLCSEVADQIRLEKEVSVRLAVDAVMQKSAPDVRRAVAEIVETAGAPSTLVDEIERTVYRVLRGEGASETDHLLHGVSDETFHQLIALIDEATARAAPEAIKLQARLDRLTAEMQRVERALQKAPTEEVVRPFVERLRSLQSELAVAEEGARNQDEVIRGLSRDVVALERRVAAVRKQIADADEEHGRHRLIASVQEALSEFATRATNAKAEELRDHFRECFAVLSRKEDMLRDVRIDPETFYVTFCDSSLRPIEKSELSAGEKQIYAIAMLWALAITSARPMPFLIDTPLGRLDSEHRASLIERYFPSVSHQVIILSTDTEIDRENFSLLKPYLARAYHLQFNSSEGATRVERGYFWEDDQHDRNKMESSAA